MKKCFLDYLKIKSNKKSLIILLILLVINMILAFDKWIIMFDFIIKIGFYKDDKFSIDLFWSAMNSIFTLLGFIGIIIVMKHDDNVRIKQNIIDSKRQLFISSQNDYENNMRIIFGEIDPKVLLDNCIKMDHSDIFKTIFTNQVFISNMKGIYDRIHSFYNYDIFNNKCKKLEEFLSLYNEFIDLVVEKETNINNCLKHYAKLKITDVQAANEYFNTECSNAFSSLVDLRNKDWFVLMDKGNEMLKERANIIMENITD